MTITTPKHKKACTILTNVILEGLQCCRFNKLGFNKPSPLMNVSPKAGKSTSFSKIHFHAKLGAASVPKLLVEAAIMPFAPPPARVSHQLRARHVERRKNSQSRRHLLRYQNRYNEFRRRQRWQTKTSDWKGEKLNLLATSSSGVLNWRSEVIDSNGAASYHRLLQSLDSSFSANIQGIGITPIMDG